MQMKTKAVIGLLLLLVVGAVILFKLDHRKGVSVPVIELDQEILESSQEVSVPLLKDTVTVSSVQDSAANQLFLANECPELLDDSIASNEKCLDAVERYFMDRSAYTVRLGGIVPQDGPFTFRSMLANHLSDHKLVVEALSRQDCRLLEGPIRTDLRETCNAEALFRYTHFTSTCRNAVLWREAFVPLQHNNEVFVDRESPHEKSYLNSEEIAELGQLNRYQYGLDESKALSAGNEALYYFQRNFRRKQLLQDVWLDTKKKCPSYVVTGSLAPLDGSTPNEEMMNWWTEGTKEAWRVRIQEYAAKHALPSDWTISVKDLEPYELLQSIAARLGFEWNLIVKDYVPGAFLDEEFQESKREFLRWKSELGQAFRNTPMKRDEVVLNVLQGVLGLREAGYKADIEYIVKSLCKTDPKWKQNGAKDCARAIRDAEARIDPQHTAVLRTLDEIEAAALRLDDYQYF